MLVPDTTDDLPPVIVLLSPAPIKLYIPALIRLVEPPPITEPEAIKQIQFDLPPPIVEQSAIALLPYPPEIVDIPPDAKWKTPPPINELAPEATLDKPLTTAAL